MIAQRLLDRGLLPDRLIRLGARRQIRDRLRQETAGGPDGRQQRLMAWTDRLRRSPIAIATADANRQHYEVPTEFYAAVLGPNLKYSCSLWDDGCTSLADAEAAMLDLYVARAGLLNGMSVLDLGCGWGSLTLWIAARYPACRITAVSNSATQRAHIEQRAASAGLDNVRVVTADINDFVPDRRFDRVFSIEMLEHVRNYEALLARIATWLEDSGRLFVHVFAHREVAYPFEVGGDDDWMARYFFTGGQMPADSLLLYFQRHLRITGHWRLSGRHYQRTAEAWLANFDANRAAIEPVMERTYGNDARRMSSYWRVFFIACAELFGFEGGEQWIVSHYLFAKS